MFFTSLTLKIILKQMRKQKPIWQYFLGKWGFCIFIGTRNYCGDIELNVQCIIQFQCGIIYQNIILSCPSTIYRHSFDLSALFCAPQKASSAHSGPCAHIAPQCQYFIDWFHPSLAGASCTHVSICICVHLYIYIHIK